MKKLSLFAAVLLAGVAAAAAQEAPAEEPAAPPEATPAPGAPAALFPESTAPGALTRPNGTPPAPGGRAAGARLHGHNRRNSQYVTDAATLQANQDPLEVRVAYRKDKTMALLRQPDLVDLLQEADSAPTDAKKREYLRAYYTKLYATINKIDKTPTMKAHVALLAAATKQRYDPQRRAVAGEDDLAGVGRGGGHNRR